jgi:tripartite-type tricarboxylate transporter receptor subunit TctC
MIKLAAGPMRRMCVSLWLAVVPLGGVAGAADFYKDRTITFIIGAAPGGGYDTYSRLIASHVGRHIAGQPTIVPQNVPGAGSIRAANYLYNVAPKDGTAIGMIDEAIFLNQILGVQEPTTETAKPGWFGGVLRRLMGTQETKTDAVKFNWIGRILANSAVLFVRREAGIGKIEDAIDKELIVSASGTASRLNWTVLKNAFAMKFKIVSGYQGSNESMLALMRGEADALSMPWSILRITGADLIRDKKINLLLQTGAEKDADLENLPRMIDLARNDDERKLLELFASPSTIGRSRNAGGPRRRASSRFHGDDAGSDLPRRSPESQAGAQPIGRRAIAGGRHPHERCPGMADRTRPAGFRNGGKLNHPSRSRSDRHIVGWAKPPGPALGGPDDRLSVPTRSGDRQGRTAWARRKSAFCPPFKSLLAIESANARPVPSPGPASCLRHSSRPASWSRRRRRSRSLRHCARARHSGSHDRRSDSDERDTECRGA